MSRGEAARWAHDDVLHAWWVEPGKVLAGEYPAHRTREWTGTMINLLVDAGVRTFVDLTSPADPLVPYAPVVEEVAARTGFDLRYRRFPIPDFGVLDDDEYDAILDTIAEGTLRGVVYVHCWGGIGRTGTVIGCLLADTGLGVNDVLARVAELRAGTRKAHRESPESDAQREVIRRRALRRSGTA